MGKHIFFPLEICQANKLVWYFLIKLSRVRIVYICFNLWECLLDILYVFSLLFFQRI
jgi:hypothetical protein